MIIFIIIGNAALEKNSENECRIQNTDINLDNEVLFNLTRENINKLSKDVPTRKSSVDSFEKISMSDDESSQDEFKDEITTEESSSKQTVILNETRTKNEKDEEVPVQNETSQNPPENSPPNFFVILLILLCVIIATAVAISVWYSRKQQRINYT